MRSWFVITLSTLIGCSSLPAASAAEQVYLEANFNDKAIDEPIGEGGAALGEPIEVTDTITAIVRDGPMGSPSLEIQDIHPWAGSATFLFLDDVEITTGMVVVAADLWFDSLADGDSCKVDVREHDGNQSQFAELIFRDDGSIKLDYGGTGVGVIGTFATGRRFRVILQFDMDAGDFDVWLDGTQVVDAAPHGITDHGIGKVRFGTLFDADSDGRFYVDAIKVSDTFEPVAVEEQSWGRIKARYR